MHPVLFSIGFLTVYSFGAMIALGYLLVGALLWYDKRCKGEDPTPLYDFSVGLVLASLLGGRLFYILLYWRDYLQDPLEVFRIYHGGLVFYGGLIGAIVYAFLYIKKKKLPLWKTLDEAVPYAVLVHAFGRIGCFLNGCCYGKPTRFILGVVFPDRSVPIHPTQLYESAGLFLIFLALRKWSRKRTPFPGAIFLGYLFSYGVLRFLVEFFRGDQRGLFWNLTLHQFLSFVLVAVSVFLWSRQKRS
ncbi:MAG: prolipoprotein diacylglyceryl transferase [Candidatus Omnitrophota bacterium]